MVLGSTARFHARATLLLAAFLVITLTLLGGCGGGRSGTNAGESFKTIIRFTDALEAPLAGVLVHYPEGSQTSDSTGTVEVESLVQESIAFEYSFNTVEGGIVINPADYPNAIGVIIDITFTGSSFEVTNVTPTELATEQAQLDPSLGDEVQLIPADASPVSPASPEKPNDSSSAAEPPPAGSNGPPTIGLQFDADIIITDEAGVPIPGALVMSADRSIVSSTNTQGFAAISGVFVRITRAKEPFLKLIVQLPNSHQRFHVMQLLSSHEILQQRLRARVTCVVVNGGSSVVSDITVESAEIDQPPVFDNSSIQPDVVPTEQSGHSGETNNHTAVSAADVDWDSLP